MRKLAYVLFIASLAACSKAAEGDGQGTTLDDGGGQFSPPGAEGGAPRPPECAEETKDIYVIAEDQSLYLFHPPTLEFKHKGRLACPTGGATPTSMAVDRTGFAWVRHSDGTIWKVNTRDLACEPTQFTPQSESFIQFGMGFATETRGGSAETLFVSDSDGAGLGRLDLKTHVLTYVGPYTGDLAGIKSELTGTGDGKLYGFFVTMPAQIAEISKGTGDIISTKELTGVFAGTAWAFSFYGGDFYIYTNPPNTGLPMNESGSDVTKYSPVDGSITVVKQKIGFKIVGAGVSTCAPTTSPR